VALPLFLGGLVYLAVRSGFALPAWTRHHLPDALWTYALTACLIVIWSRSTPATRAWCAVVGSLAALTHELGQAASVFPGTFDVQDVLWSCAAAILAVGTASIPLTPRRHDVAHPNEATPVHPGSLDVRAPGAGIGR
jgi:hypothetical protein